MSSQYTVSTQQTVPSTPPPASVRRTASLRAAAAMCVVGGLIAVVGATVSAVVPASVSPDLLSYPFSPGTFRLTEVLWTITHALTLMGAVGLARSGLGGSGRLGRIGLFIALLGMSLLIPTELAFAFAADAVQESTTSMVLGTAIGLAATLAGIGFVLAGIATLRARLWSGWGRFTPLLAGVWVIVVLIPVQAVWPEGFLWPIAGWNACLTVLGVALHGAAPDRDS